MRKVNKLILFIFNYILLFQDDPSQKPRGEDSQIAWTWKKFLENQTNPYILSRMPMTKASVRAMDAVTEIAAEKKVANLTRFLVAGASKVFNSDIFIFSNFGFQYNHNLF